MANTMAFKVFLTYSLDPSEAALAWRLQTLAAAYGVEMYVPRRGGSASQQKAFANEAIKEIDRSDCVLAIITGKTEQAVEIELSHALARKKPVVPIVRSDLAGQPLLAQFPSLFTFSPTDDPGSLESQVFEFLRQQQLTKEMQQAMGALVAIGLGLLLLYSVSEK